MTHHATRATPTGADLPETSRRRFLRALAILAVSGRTLLRSGDARAALAAAREAARSEIRWPEMTYRALGNTGWRASRLVFGCGAALSGRRRDDLLDSAFDAGINVFDVGFRGYYRDAEVNLAPFLKRHRDDVFLISKAKVLGDANPDEPLAAQSRDCRRLPDAIGAAAPGPAECVHCER